MSDTEQDGIHAVAFYLAGHTLESPDPEILPFAIDAEPPYVQTYYMNFIGGNADRVDFNIWAALLIDGKPTGIVTPLRALSFEGEPLELDP